MELLHVRALDAQGLRVEPPLGEVAPQALQAELLLGPHHAVRNLERVGVQHGVDRPLPQLPLDPARLLSLDGRPDLRPEVVETLGPGRVPREIVVEVRKLPDLDVLQRDPERRFLAGQLLGAIVGGELHGDRAFLSRLHAEDPLLEPGNQGSRTHDHGPILAAPPREGRSVHGSLVVDHHHVALPDLVTVGGGFEGGPLGTEGLEPGLHLGGVDGHPLLLQTEAGVALGLDRRPNLHDRREGYSALLGSRLEFDVGVRHGNDLLRLQRLVVRLLDDAPHDVGPHPLSVEPVEDVPGGLPLAEPRHGNRPLKIAVGGLLLLGDFVSGDLDGELGLDGTDGLDLHLQGRLLFFPSGRSRGSLEAQRLGERLSWEVSTQDRGETTPCGRPDHTPGRTGGFRGEWCERGDSNPHGCPLDPKSSASASSATLARGRRTAERTPLAKGCEAQKPRPGSANEVVREGKPKSSGFEGFQIMELSYPDQRTKAPSLPSQPANRAGLRLGPRLAVDSAVKDPRAWSRGSGTGGAAMKRCGYCGRAVWSTPGEGGRFCRDCDATLRSDATTRVARIRDCLATARAAGDLDAALPRLQEAMEHVGKLVTYDRLGVRPIIPDPSLLTAMVESHRKELARRPRNGNNGRGRIPPGPALAPSPSAPGPAARPDSASNGTRRGTSSEGNTPGRDRRTEKRERSHLLARLEPGRVHVLVEDISPRGLLLRSPSTRLQGSRVRLTVETARGPVHLEGVVRWVRGSGGRHDETLSGGMGVELTGASATLSRAGSPAPLDKRREATL